jgi:hypothetical protein
MRLSSNSLADNVGGMVSCRLRATFLSNYKELQAGGNASILTNTAINYTTCYSQLLISIMDNKLRQELRAKKIREMKNPTILMNENDFEVFKRGIESKTTIVVGDNLTYEGVPIKTNNIIQSGNIVVYDDVSFNWL